MKGHLGWDILYIKNIFSCLGKSVVYLLGKFTTPFHKGHLS